LKGKLLLAVFVLLLLAAFAFAVNWYPVSFRYNWNSRGFGFCPQESQCLVSSAGNHSFDGFPEKYFSPIKPYCINNSQYVLDFYCSSGNWSSRTKLIAVELLKIAEAQSPNDFSLFCGPANITANNINYEVEHVPVKNLLANYCNPYSSVNTYDCVNSVCVLRYGNNTAFGTSLNIPVEDNSKSFLKVLGKSVSACSGAKNLDGDFDLCSDNIWYNHNTESIIVLPSSYSSNSLSSTVSDTIINKYFTQPFADVRSFARAQSNSSFIDSTHLFSNLYFAKKGSKEVFGFLEKDQGQISHDYFGIVMKGIDFNGYSLCSDLIGFIDDKTLCRDSPNVVLVSAKTREINQSLVNAWSDVTSKLRLR